ncbi:UTRA domain-containing protein [Streptomyces sp. Ju416(a)]|uniref:UTRA domain-containing protein n=1 Tax=Streptomyces sp. Ju416(a) TaxID=3446591 RepID=UPI00403DEBEA
MSTSGHESERQLLVRRGNQRLAHEQWGSGHSVWDAELAGRDLVVDQVRVEEGTASENAARVLGLDEGESVCVRSRRFVLDGKPVLLSTSFLPAPLVESSAITQPDTGPGGIYARLAELGSDEVVLPAESGTPVALRRGGADASAPGRGSGGGGSRIPCVRSSRPTREL